MPLTYNQLRNFLYDGTVYDYADDYGEPGYTRDNDNDAPILIGYWWCRCDATPDLHSITDHYPELDDHDLLWSDEWVVVDNKAYRTKPDSYGWQPTAILPPDDCEYVVPAEEGLPATIEMLDAIDNPRTAIFARWFSPADLADDGWTIYEPDDPHFYESGWHPHQTDDPETVLATISENLPDHETVFYISATGQFDIRWQAYTRPRTDA